MDRYDITRKLETAATFGNRVSIRSMAIGSLTLATLVVGYEAFKHRRAKEQQAESALAQEVEQYVRNDERGQ